MSSTIPAPYLRRERRSFRASLSRRSLRRSTENFTAELQQRLEYDAASAICRALRAKAAREGVLRVLRALDAVAEGAASSCSLPAVAAAARLVGGLRPGCDAVMWAQMRAAAALHAERGKLAAVDHAWEAVRRVRHVVQVDPQAQAVRSRRELDHAQIILKRSMQLVHPITYRPDAAEVARVLNSLSRIVKKRKLGWKGEYGSGWQDAVRTERRLKPSKPHHHTQSRTRYRDVLSFANEASSNGKASPESIRSTAELFEHRNDIHIDVHVDGDHENVYASSTRTRTQVQNVQLQQINAAQLISRAWRARVVHHHARNHLLALNQAFNAHTKATNALHSSLVAVNSINQAHPLHNVSKRLAARTSQNTTCIHPDVAGSTSTASARSRALTSAAGATILRAFRAVAIRRRNIPVRLRRMRAAVNHALQTSAQASGTVRGADEELSAARHAVERLGLMQGLTQGQEQNSDLDVLPTMTRVVASLRLQLDAASRARHRVEQLRARNAADAAVAIAKENARHHATHRIARWTEYGKYKGDLRALLASLHRVLPPDAAAQWKHSAPSPDENTEPNKIRAIYRKALLHVHPDRLTARHATPNEHALAHLVFVQLQEAYSIFAKKELR